MNSTKQSVWAWMVLCALFLAISVGCAPPVAATPENAATPSNIEEGKVIPEATGSVAANEPTDGADMAKKEEVEPAKASPAAAVGEQAKKDAATTPKAGEEVAVIETSLGRIVFRFFPDKAPETVKSFKTLAGRKFYDGTKFHRVIPGFMIQGGDPNTKDDNREDDGMGGPGFNLKAEFNDTPHRRGIVSMARAQDPDSAGSQFFIVVSDSNFLDGQYTAFGEVVTGMDVADRIVNLPRNDRDYPDTPPVKRTVRIAKWPVR